MDKFEQKLKNYYQYHSEYQPEAISGDLLQRLKALEASPEAAKQPRRRYVLPLAAVIALALCLGSLWAWTRFSRPEGADAPNVTLEEPAAPAADNPAVPSMPATPEEKRPTDKTPPAPAEPVSEEPVSITEPVQSDPSLPAPDGSASDRPEEDAPLKPDSTTAEKQGDPATVKPNDPAPAASDNPASGKPYSKPRIWPDNVFPLNPGSTQPVTPDDPNPPEPGDPTSAETTDPDPPEPEDPDPPEDNTDVSPEPPEIGAVYRLDGNWETLVLTLLSTGKSVEIDVTGWKYNARPAHNDPQSGGEIVSTFSGTWYAFGGKVIYFLTLYQDGSVQAEAYDLEQYEQQNADRKENSGGT